VGARLPCSVSNPLRFCVVCPQPPDPLIVAGSILGGVVLLGLIILALIKMIIWWISRREVKEWEKERGKNTITSVSTVLPWPKSVFYCMT